VASGEMLRQLLERNFVRIFGRSEQLGRPFLYATTREFLQEFGLRNLQDLPGGNELIGQGLPNWNNSDQISSLSIHQPKPVNADHHPGELR
jgi:segregation and condensation protein B